MAEQMVTISLKVSEEDKRKLMEIADSEDRSLSQLLRIIVKNYLKDKEKNT